MRSFFSACLFENVYYVYVVVWSNQLVMWPRIDYSKRMIYRFIIENIDQTRNTVQFNIVIDWTDEIIFKVKMICH